MSLSKRFFEGDYVPPWYLKKAALEGIGIEVSLAATPEDIERLYQQHKPPPNPLRGAGAP